MNKRRTRSTLVVGLLTIALAACSPARPEKGPIGEIIATPKPTVAATVNLPTPTHEYTDLKSPDRPDIVVEDYPAKPPGMTNPPAGSGYDRYFGQTIRWGKCALTRRPGTECAKVLTPLDWTNPDGPAITLAIKRLKATSKLVDAASPDIFINPGGPGGSAQEYLDGFRTVDLTGYNIVAVDPRGSGESTPVVCGTMSQLDAYFNLDASPDDDTEKAALIEGNKQFALQCRQNSGALLDHISTIEAVYDFDMVRQLMGDAKFNWLGVSYGTFIGAVYLELYPQNAGRMILDAVVNITDKSGVSQPDGFDLALHKYAQWAAQHGHGASEDAVMKKLTEFTDKLDANPIRVGSRLLTQTQFIQGLALTMYIGTSFYPQLAQMIDSAYSGDGSPMLQMADAMTGRTASGYESIATAFPAILCKDSADAGIDYSFAGWKEVATSAPFFGKYFGPDLVCDVWTAKPAPQIDFRGADDPPFLAIGGTGDNATPYQYAQWLVEQMPSGILVTRDGVGHGSYDAGSTCIDNIVTAFFNKGTLPTNGTTCQMD